MYRGWLYRYTLLIWLTLLPSALLRAGGADQEVALPSHQAKGQAEKSSQPEQPQRPILSVTVQDDNGIAVPSARVDLVKAGTQTSYKCGTDYAGRCEFDALDPGVYQLRVEKEGFYTAILSDLRVGEVQNLEVTLNHQQEIAETLDVVDSPEAIDLAETASSQSLRYREILNVPYPSTRDFRNALPFIPGVLQDPTGQIHVGGSETYQIFDHLDGFNITHPTSGLLDMRVSTDALRSLEVQSSRYSAEYGKGSGGVLGLATGMGDDHYRFTLTNFIPSVQNRKGLHFDDWTPRATFSGPLQEKKAWFFVAPEGEYKLNIIEELPAGADQNPVWRFGNLGKVQLNLSPTNILTVSFLLNQFHAAHAGLSFLNPLEATVTQSEEAYLFTAKDQAYLSNGMLLEIGIGASRFHTQEQPQGDSPYVVRPEGTSGNHYRTADGQASRLQGIANLTLPPTQWYGRHEFKLGTDMDRITYDQFYTRQPILVLREDGTLSRKVTFGDSPRFGENNLELSGFAQDRWSLSDRWLVETGLRLDWDQILRHVLVSPRLASSYMLTRDGNTKIAAGVGIFHDATNLDFITRPLSGRRLDAFFATDGQTLQGPPLETSFLVNTENLEAPRFLNWSLSLERQWPASVHMRIEFIQKRGSQGFTFVNQATDPLAQARNLFELRNDRQDRYDSVQITVRRTFKGNHTVMASYTRSAARSNAVLDFNVDNLFFGQQAGGPLPWDVPNRLLSWGWLPMVKKFDLAYALDWRDGFPFSQVNQEQELVGAPNSLRFPAYFSLNLHLERYFRSFGFQWALRAGFNNVTNRSNPTVVNNNVDSPQYLTFAGFQHRAFTARIRILGRK